jgi:hypothetical protein
MTRTVRTAALLLLAVVSAAEAQVVPGRFQVAVQGAYQNYDNSAALKGSPSGGFQMTYFLTRNLGIGAHIMAGRPWTDESFFPYVRYSFLSSDESNDTTLLYQVKQRVTHMQLGVDGTFRLPLGRFAPFATANIGQYRFYLDPQQNNGLKRVNGLTYGLGAGVEVAVAGNSGFRFTLLDQVMTDYDRDAFCVNCSGAMALLREDRFQNPFPEPPQKKSTVHNLRIVGSFSFIPGAGQ